MRLRHLFLFLSIVFATAFPLSSKGESLQLTPVTGDVLGGALSPVQGSDGEYHLAYEIQLNNVSPKAWQVEQLSAFGGDKLLLELNGDELKSRMGPLSARGGSVDLGPNQSAMIWIHIKVTAQRDIPKNIRHQIVLKGDGKRLVMKGPGIPVSSQPVLAIGAPLKGDQWIAGDGCCDSIRHVRALLPIDGKLYASQRFAIDWEKLGEGRRIFRGDAKNPENYFCYGEDVLAVADGVVASMEDGLPNQVPGKLPEGLDVNQADGNHIILLIAPGHYALYAHLKPGSVRVKPGDRVTAGQVIAQVGNSGNTSEPHLHFHLMDGPSTLASNGLPYVLKSFEWLGRAGSTAAFDKAAAEGSALAIQDEKPPRNHRDQLPLDLSLVRFP